MTFVVPEDMEVGTLKGWRTSVGIASDPKNPWPPPGQNAMACDVATATWLSQGFAAQAESIWLDRSH